MKKILIATVVGDIHATAVAVALERMGHQPVLWFASDLPVQAAASIHLPATGTTAAPDISLSLPNALGAPCATGAFDTYWHRRRGEPVIDVPLLACDRDIAERESQRMVTGLMDALSQTSFAVNSMRAARNTEDKIGQLRLARQLGLQLPETLISNAPDRVRSFVSAHERTGVIVKNFAPICWLGEGSAAVNFTARLSADMLPDDAMLRLTPAIYQALVPKAYEVRVTCMGAERVAVALHSQEEAAARLDWRGVAPNRLGIRRVELPADVATRCDAFLAAMDLRFGCFDFIVTPQGEWVFLEVNQMGQFLWVEEAAPEIPLLQMFCDFLVARDPGFRFRRSGCAIGFDDVIDEAADRLEAAAAIHQRPATPPFVYADA